MSRKTTQKRETITLLGRKWHGNVKEAKKIHSYVRYETNSAAKRKAIWSKKLDFYLQILAKWSLERQQKAGVSSAECSSSKALT